MRSPATDGVVDTLFLDIDAVVPGTVEFAEEQGAGTIGVADEVARRAWLAGARLVAVRRADVPGGGDPRRHHAIRRLTPAARRPPVGSAHPGR